MKRIFLVLLAACLIGAIAQYNVSNAQDRDSVRSGAATKQFSALMRMKLDKAKGMLEGLSLEDPGLVAKNAKEMKLLSLESGWNAIQTKEYAEQSRDFRRACDSIVKAAEAKDINKATLGYLSLTIRCVECHNYIRNQGTE
jgi:hypothetical protein